jgi:hypothetical protein
MRQHYLTIHSRLAQIEVFVLAARPTLGLRTFFLFFFCSFFSFFFFFLFFFIFLLFACYLLPVIFIFFRVASHKPSHFDPEYPLLPPAQLFLLAGRASP